MVANTKAAPAAAKAAPKDPAGEAFTAFMADLAAAIPKLEKLILSKAVSYVDANAAREALRADRAALLSKVHLAFAERVEGAAEHPVEGLYIGEADLVIRYREKLRVGGIFVLPTVVETIPADASGNVGVVVEYALADVEGRYWPAAVRVSGIGNDRLARGLVGPLAMSRALSAAWKEAICRIAFLGREFDPEAHIVPLDAAPASSRPSNSQGQRREPTLSIREEENWRDKALQWIGERTRAEEIVEWMNLQRTKDMLAKMSTRNRQRVTGEADECIARLRPDHGEDRAGSRREAEGRQDDGGRRSSYDGDDDIPF